MNAFSREAFPTLHVEQIATRSPGGEVLVTVSHDLVVEGQKIGIALSETEAGTSLLIAPHSCFRWGIHRSTNAARQVLHEQCPGENVYIKSDDAPKKLPEKAYIISTVYKLKGQERQYVCVYGLGADYTILAPISRLSKLLFVAISRPKDILHLFVPGCDDILSYSFRNSTYQLLANICTHYSKAAPVQDLKIRSRPPKLVNGLMISQFPWPSLGQIRNMTTAWEPFSSLPTLSTVYRNDSDFVSMVTKATLAQALGCFLPSVSSLVFKEVRDTKHCGFFYQNDTWTVCERKEKRAIFEQWCSQSCYETAPFWYAGLLFSLHIKSLWTVSERLGEESHLDQFSSDARSTVHALRSIVPPWDEKSPPVFRSNRLYSCFGMRDSCRSVKTLINYAPDLIFICDNCRNSDGRGCSTCPVVEFKHCITGLTNEYNAQASAYAFLMGRPFCFLINLADGEVRKVFANPDFELFARTSVSLRNARNRGYWLAEHKKKVFSLPSLAPVLVALDTESTMSPPFFITEVGAIAFSADDFSILSVFHTVSPGVLVGSDPSAPVDTGLVVSDPDLLSTSQSTVVGSFTSWLDSFSKECTLLHWGGKEKKLARPFDVTIEVCHQLFRPWIERNNSDFLQSALSLSEAVDRLGFPAELQPVYHRAFEDALAISMIFATIVNTATTV